SSVLQPPTRLACTTAVTPRLCAWFRTTPGSDKGREAARAAWPPAGCRPPGIPGGRAVPSREAAAGCPALRMVLRGGVFLGVLAAQRARCNRDGFLDQHAADPLVRRATRLLPLLPHPHEEAQPGAAYPERPQGC